MPGRLVTTYRLRCPTYEAAKEIATAIAREQTLEVPAGVVDEELEARLLGQVEDICALPEGGFDTTISYALEVTGTELLQVVNVAFGNVSLMNGVRLVGLILPAEVLEALPGPGYGLARLVRMVGSECGRPRVTEGARQEPSRRNPEVREERTHTLGTPASRREVVLRGAPLVGVPLQTDAHGRATTQDLYLRL